ncbi:MAG: WS/DGAT domain-containing protein [Blastococcus sp.]
MARRRMSPEDSLWLELDRPTNQMVITSVLWTETPVDPDRLREVLERRVLARYPVFSQRPVVRSGLVRRGFWVDDPEFDIDRHLVVRSMPGRGDRAALQDFVAAQRSDPLDPAHPLWRVHLLQGYAGGSALVQRYHHAMADGIRLTQVMLALLNPLGDGEVSLTAQVGGRTPVRGLPGIAGAGLALLHTGVSALKIALWTNPGTALDGQPAVPKTAAWTEPLPLEQLSAVAHATGVTVNDVCTTLVAGAVARYLEGLEAPARRLLPGDDDLAWMIPVNLDPPTAEPPPDLGNHFALVLAVLPHGPGSFRDRLAEVHRRIVRIRRSWEPVLTEVIAQGLALMPTELGAALSRVLAAKAVGVLTNVPGPRSPMTLAGARVTGVVGWAPPSGRETMTVCIFSYAGGVTFGFGTDRSVLPDAQGFVDALDAEWAEATGAVLTASAGARTS